MRHDLWRAQKQAQDESELDFVTEMDCEADRQSWIDGLLRDAVALLVLLVMMFVVVWVGVEAWGATLESYRGQVAPYVKEIEQHGGRD